MEMAKAKINKNEYTLKSGRKIKLKPVTLDMRDELVDKVEFIFDNKNNITGVTAMQKNNNSLDEKHFRRKYF